MFWIVQRHVARDLGHHIVALNDRGVATREEDAAGDGGDGKAILAHRVGQHDFSQKVARAHRLAKAAVIDEDARWRRPGWSSPRSG